MSYTTFLSMTLLLMGATLALASEVTGTLSSDTSSNTQTTGSISGTVTSESGGSSSGGSRRSSGGDSVSNAPVGAVLGESISVAPTPSFPNAGFAPEDEPARATVWSTVVAFFRNLVSF